MTDVVLVVPAAGRGTRLAGTIPAIPKVLLPFGGKPVLQHVLDAGLQIPLSQIVIVVGEQGQQIESCIGNSYRGVPVAYVAQPQPHGLAHAVSLAEPFVRDGMLVINGDEIFLDARQMEMFRFFDQMQADAIVGFLRHENERILLGYGMDMKEDLRVQRLVEKPKAVWNDVLGVGNWLVRADFFDTFRRTPKSPARGEVDFVGVLQLMIEEGKLVYGFDLQAEFINVNRPEDMVRAEAAFRRRSQVAAVAP